MSVTAPSLYTANIVFTSGIIAWIIFIITLFFMKNETFISNNQNLNKQKPPSINTNPSTKPSTKPSTNIIPPSSNTNPAYYTASAMALAAQASRIKQQIIVGSNIESIKPEPKI